MGKKSTNLLLISLVILLLLGVNIFFIIFHTNNIEDDATAINSAGIIRGSIQRIVKLEINGIEADEAIRETDKVFEAFKSRRIIIKGKSQEFTILFDKMAENWTEIKNNIKSYRLDRTEEERRKLLNLSENIWENANDMVLAAQQVSQGKVRNFNILVLLLLINILPVIILFV